MTIICLGNVLVHHFLVTPPEAILQIVLAQIASNEKVISHFKHFMYNE